jgi:hypothetical protein
LYQNNIDIVLLAEHFLKTEQIDNIAILNFKKITHFSRHIYQKGGVAIYAKNNLLLKEIHFNHNEEKILNVVWLK